MTATTSGTTTFYVGNYYEKTGTTVRKYYYHGGRRVAMRENGVLSWLLTDQLGSTVMTLTASAGITGELKYKAYGETRYTYGSPSTKYRFTGQREESSIGLYFYNARWYDAVLGRFAQADTIVPEPRDSQSLNRYSYVLNNPWRYVDPTGLFSEEEIMKYLGVDTWDEVLAFFETGGHLAGKWGWLAVLRQAQLGDEVQFLEGYAGFWPAPGPGASIASRGTFVESNGSLYVRGAEGNLIAGSEVAKTGNAYLLARPSSDPRLPTLFGPYYAERTYYQLQFDPGRVDWVGAGLDLAGIAADAFTLGVAGRLDNAAKLARTRGDLVGKGINLADVASGVAHVVREGEVTRDNILGLATDVAGFWIPIGPDVLGLLLNFAQACYRTP